MKQACGKDLYLLASVINKAASRNKTIVFFKSTSNHSRIMTLLAQQGFIASYQALNGFIVVRLNYTSKKTPVATIEKASRLGRSNRTIALSELKKMQQQSGGVSTLLLNTDKGILSSSTAIEKGLGGRVLFKLQ
jgi:ribosomal protein S8